MKTEEELKKIGKEFAEKRLKEKAAEVEAMKKREKQ